MLGETRISILHMFSVTTKIKENHSLLRMFSPQIILKIFQFFVKTPKNLLIFYGTSIWKSKIIATVKIFDYGFSLVEYSKKKDGLRLLFQILLGMFFCR